MRVGLCQGYNRVRILLEVVASGVPEADTGADLGAGGKSRTIHLQGMSNENQSASTFIVNSKSGPT